MLCSWRWWATLAGVALQLFGLGLAISGLHAASRAVLQRPLPPGRAWLNTRARVRRWLGRPEPQVRGGGSGTVGVSGSGFARQSYNPPPATAPFEEWMGYLREHAALTDKALDDLGNRLGGAERTMRQSIDRESETRSGEIARVESMVRDSVAGPDRAGLDRAWYGLTATAIGIAMAGVATLWP